MESPIIIDKSNLNELFSAITNSEAGVLLLVNKPYKWTSADVVRKIKFRLQHAMNLKKLKVGHAGTLDPLATGVLIVCLGKATKISETIQAQKKEYIAEICFGATTPSYDLEKEIDHTYSYLHITEEKIREILPSFIGTQEQVPPIFSAKFIDGVRAYEMARAGAGDEVSIKSSTITIYDMEILKFESPKLTLRIECSKGTYIRALARDFGLALNSGAHLTALERSRSGEFFAKNGISIEDFETFLNLTRISHV